MRRSSGRLAEVVCMCILPAYYETSNNLLSFPTHFPFKIARSQFETQKRPVSVGYFKSLHLV
jgi:hypothetical protein